MAALQQSAAHASNDRQFSTYSNTSPHGAPRCDWGAEDCWCAMRGPGCPPDDDIWVFRETLIKLTFLCGKRSDLHRLFARLLPEETEFIQHALLHDLHYTFTDLPSGKTLEVKVIAANEIAEAAPTEVAGVVVG